jgi:hypothetical protein
LQTSDTPSRFFSITSALFARVSGAAPSPPKYAHQSAPARPATRSRTQRPNADQANWIWSLFAMSLFRHIVTSSLSSEKPYPTPYHLIAKRYRTHPRSVGVYSGFRVCLRCPGWSPGFQGLYLQTLS